MTGKTHLSSPLHWPPCDPCPMQNITNKQCLIIKAKCKYTYRVNQYINNFGEYYSRSLALFYANEAEQKARKQEGILKDYVAQLQDYLKSLKAGKADAERPTAPKEIFPVDPLEKDDGTVMGTMSISSVSVSTSSSFTYDLVQEKGMQSKNSSSLSRQTSDESIINCSGLFCTKSQTEYDIGGLISDKDTICHTNESYQKQSQDSMTCVTDDVNHKTSRNRLYSQKSVYNTPIEETANESRTNVKDASKEKTVENVKTSDNEANAGSDYYSDWTMSDSESSDEASSSKTQSKSVQVSDKKSLSEQTVKSKSSSSLNSNCQEDKDADDTIQNLEAQIKELDTQIEEKNNELNEILKETIANADPANLTPVEIAALRIEEQKLLTQISDVKAKLGQLDQATLAPHALKEFCTKLVTAVDPSKTAEILSTSLGSNPTQNYLRKDLQTPQITPSTQPTPRIFQENLSAGSSPSYGNSSHQEYSPMQGPVFPPSQPQSMASMLLSPGEGAPTQCMVMSGYSSSMANPMMTAYNRLIEKLSNNRRGPEGTALLEIISQHVQRSSLYESTVPAH